MLQVSKEVCNDVLVQLSAAAGLLGAGTHGEVSGEPRGARGVALCQGKQAESTAG